MLSERVRRGWAVVLLLVALAAPAHAADLLIRNASLIDGTGAPPRRGVSILVRDGRITEIAPAIHAPDAVALDASGATVLPGLVDAHVHLLFAPGSGFRDDSRETIRALNAQHLRAYLACGVTTVLDAGTTAEEARWIQAWLTAGKPGPRYLTTGPYVRPAGGYGSDLFGAETTPAEVEAKLDLLQALGAAGVKLAIEDGAAEFSPELRDVVVAGARRRGLPLYVHATSERAQDAALDLGAHALMHAPLGGILAAAVFGSSDLSPAFVERMQRSGAYQLTTFSLIDNWPGHFDPAVLDDPLVVLTVPAAERATARDPASERYFAVDLFGWIMPWMPETLRPWIARLGFRRDALEESLRYSQRNVLALHRAGVPIVVATDAPSPWTASSTHFHGPTTLREVELLGAAGVEPLEAIAAATRHPARMLGLADEIGTVEPGKRADLLIVDGDPSRDLRDLRRVRWTVKDGAARTPREWMTD